MTHIRNSEELKEIPNREGAETCDFCETKPVSGYWNTRIGIGVCFECAVDALPKLIVDAWHHEMVDTKQAEKIEESMRASFWKGVASRVSRDVKAATTRKPR